VGIGSKKVSDISKKKRNISFTWAPRKGVSSKCVITDWSFKAGEEGEPEGE
tara:strand:+ start:1394 stop:1546 length:153 start_codon:yes stop_codon:yes gene_type:complete